MTAAEMAKLHSTAMVHGTAWGADTFQDMRAETGHVEVVSPHGFVLGRLILDEAEIHTIAVDPKAQGQRHGERLLRDFVAQVRERGASLVFLEVSEQNAPARRLYQKLGFEEVGRRENYYKPTNRAAEDALILRKLLNS
ncbi:MAG: ribosomal protein S18-alanine N-acetyltransferase [Rhodobacteraceae bacterium]|nr:ribosomal protein S18-alanine N-acetyltransferase [Paracoccaceae bacterium]